LSDTTIEWTNKTWNPVRGCSIVSPGCTNCYAMKQAHRFSGDGGAYEGLTQLTKGGPVWTGKVRCVPELLDDPLRWRKPKRVFVNSMGDLFHEDVPDSFIDAVFGVMAITTRHSYQVLTKRPQRMLEYFRRLKASVLFSFPERITDASVAARARTKDKGYDNCGPLWPLENVWLGVSVEDQARADERIPLLLQVPAAVRWISAEPLLGPVNPRMGSVHNNGIDWVVVGGESGHGARGMEYQWALSLRDQCEAAGVAFFMKQIVSAAKVKLPFEMFPERLQMRQYPA
jgi:protein gp37